MGIFSIFRRPKSGPAEQATQPLQAVMTEKGDFGRFYNSLLRTSLIILITGKRGSGKSALGMVLLEAMNRGRKRCYVLGYDDAKLPRWIKKAKTLEDVADNSVALVDEGAVAFFSREAMKQPSKTLSKIMAIARHKNLSLILIAQSSAMIDLNVLRLADVVMLKEPSLLQAKFERKAIREMYEKVEPIFKQTTEREKYFYVWSDEFEGLVSYGLPGFWSNGLSKVFKRIK